MINVNLKPLAQRSIKDESIETSNNSGRGGGLRRDSSSSTQNTGSPGTSAQGAVAGSVAGASGAVGKGNMESVQDAPSVVGATPSASTPSFNPSSAYQDAMNYTNQLLQQLSSGRTSYTDQIKDLMGQIQNRDPFAYDMNSDMLFQQYLSSAMNSGKLAMQDTMGQAAALTGGYGSTYSQAVGNQAYNAYIQDAYANLPEYYNLALEAYQMEGQEMYNQLAMLGDADTTEYQRLYDAYNLNHNNAQQMYSNEYQKWADEVALAQSESQFAQEMAYKNAALEQENEQFYAGMLSDLSGGTSIDDVDMMNFKQEAANIFNQYGEANAVAYIESLPDLYKEEVLEYVQMLQGTEGYQNTFAADAYSGYVEEDDIPLEYRQWTKVNDKKAKDQFGNKYAIEELPPSVQKKLAEKENKNG